MTHQKNPIEPIAVKFSSWRSNRQHKLVKIPEELLELAAKLCKFHSIIEVSKAVKVPRRKLELKLAELGGSRNSKRPHSKVDFIRIALPDRGLENTGSNRSVVCEFTRPDGTQMKLVMESKDLGLVMTSFLVGAS